MAIQQVAFYVPPEIEAKIALGVLRQCGGIVRDNKGRIVKHLKEVPVEPGEAVNNAVKLLDLAKNNKNIAIGVGIAAVAGVVAVGGFAANKIRSRKTAKAAELAVAEVAAEFGEALQHYMDAIRSGSMEEEIIDRLLESIEVLVADDDVKVPVSLKQMKALCSSIYEYSVTLEKANKVKVVDFERPKTKSSDDAFDDVRQCLLSQKRIFQMVA